jgi:hypothetical protein
MASNQLLILSYIVFIWMVVLHTFEEIANGVMELQVGHIQMTKNRYLFAASAISTVNMGTLALLVLGIPLGFYLGLFSAAVIGVLQAIVHGIGYLRENRKAQGLGVGFYSSIPLAITGLIVLTQLIGRVF